MKQLPIRSFRDPGRPEPWADLALTDGSLDVTVNELNGLDAYLSRTGRPLPPGWERRPNPTTHTLTLSADTTPNPSTGVAPADEVHALAVTEAGDLEFVPTSQQRPIYYAHLAWYDPATGEWDALEFTDVGDPAP